MIIALVKGLAHQRGIGAGFPRIHCRDPTEVDQMKWKYVAVASVLVVALTASVAHLNYVTTQKMPVRVGILHSRTGTMAISEEPVVRATLLAIDELNESGGVAGRRIEPVVMDGKSTGADFGAGAESLIVEHGVAAIFGCWTSESRKVVREVVERHDHLLFYPVRYEGLELSPNIVYTGSAPNQQFLPAVPWAVQTLGRRFYLVGSDYVFPRVANALLKDHIDFHHGEVTGEAYVPLGGSDFSGVAATIQNTRPDVILNTVNGDSNLHFFAALRAAGIMPDDIPVISFSVTESELDGMQDVAVAGDYLVWNYFQSIEGEANRAFVDKIHARFGANYPVNDPMEAAYLGVKLWALAVESVGATTPQLVRRAVGDKHVAAPSGIAYIERETQHARKTVRIGRIQADRTCRIVWSSVNPIRPAPYPPHRSRKDWDRFVDSLYRQWGDRWSGAPQG